MKDRSSHHLTRRKMLAFLGGATAAAIFGDGRAKPSLQGVTGNPSLPSSAHAATLPACVVRPEQTEGPYFVDEKLNRSDIRGEPSDNSVIPGVLLKLEFQVSRVAGDACAPLGGAVVDIWHCDALGVYSDARDSRFDTRGKKFLRGYQQTDTNGRAEFLSIYPGWYEGRAVHIHFKIRYSQTDRAQEFTSQLYFDEAITDQVLKQSPYSGKSGRRTMNDDDFIFRRGGKQLLLTPTKNAQGYSAKFDIGLKIA